MWTMVQHFLHVSDLIFKMHQIRILMHPRSLLKRSRIDLKNTLTLTVGMRLNQGLPRINTMMNPMNLGCHLLNPKKHADKSRHKVRSRYVSSSSEEDRSSATRHRSSKPSGALSDQDQPQHDPDPPYYREVALSDVPSQYAEEVDTFRRISFPKSVFIALIHPIQWTIALPVGATGPAKRQKKTSCIYFQQDRSQSVHSLGVASYFLPV